MVTLNELDPKAFKALNTFKELLKTKFSNMLIAWNEGQESRAALPAHQRFYTALHQRGSDKPRSLRVDKAGGVREDRHTALPDVEERLHKESPS